MKTSALDGYWTVRFVPMTIPRTVLVSELLKQSVKDAPPLPPGYEDIWDDYWDRAEALKRRALKRTLKEVPELKEAIDDIMNYIREAHGVVTARLTSPNAKAREAAVVLMQEIFPTGLEIITDAQPDIVAWAMINAERLDGEYSTEVKDARLKDEVAHLKNSVQNYVRLATRYQVEPILGPDDRTSRALRDETQDALRGVIIELVHVVKRHPSYQSVVDAILRPLDEMMAKIRATRRKKAKAEEAKAEKTETKIEKTEAKASQETGTDAVKAATGPQKTERRAANDTLVSGKVNAQKRESTQTTGPVTSSSATPQDTGSRGPTAPPPVDGHTSKTSPPQPSSQAQKASTTSDAASKTRRPRKKPKGAHTVEKLIRKAMKIGARSWRFDRFTVAPSSKTPPINVDDSGVAKTSLVNAPPATGQFPPDLGDTNFDPGDVDELEGLTEEEVDAILNDAGGSSSGRPL